MTQDLHLLEEGFRWFGPGDPVPLSYIRQAGAGAVFTSLHRIPYGEPWRREEIRERKETVEAAGLRWAAVESAPVHEDIKTGRGDLKRLFENYTATLRNLAELRGLMLGLRFEKSRQNLNPSAHPKTDFAANTSRMMIGLIFPPIAAGDRLLDAVSSLWRRDWRSRCYLYHRKDVG